MKLPRVAIQWGVNRSSDCRREGVGVSSLTREALPIERPRHEQRRILDGGEHDSRESTKEPVAYQLPSTLRRSSDQRKTHGTQSGVCDSIAYQEIRICIGG